MQFMEYESTSHAKFLILYHLIFVCKHDDISDREVNENGLQYQRER